MDRLAVVRKSLTATIRGHWRVLSVAPALTAVTVSAWLFLYPPLFASTATLEILPDSRSASPELLDRELGTLAQQLRSDSFMQYLFDQTGDSGVGGYRSPPDLLGQLRLEIIPRTRLLQLRFTSRDPRVPQRTLDHITRRFLLFQQALQTERLRRETRIVLDRIEVLASGMFSDLAWVRQDPAAWQLAVDGLATDAVPHRIETVLMERVLADYDRALQGGIDAALFESASGVSDVRSRPYVTAAVSGYGLTFLMLLLVALLHRYRISMSFPEQLAARLAIPLAGVLPLLSATARQQGRALTDTDYAEAMRSLRTRLSQMQNMPGGETDLLQPHRARILLCTAPEVGSGTSTAARHLALMAGQIERVLLIDANLRESPTDVDCCGLDRRAAGLSHLLAGAAPMRRCLHSPDGAGIDVIPAGVVPPNPHGLLAGSRMRRVLKVLRQRYDLIIIDGPAAGPHGDAELLSGHADQLLYVVDQRNRGDAAELMPALSRVRQAGGEERRTLLLCNAVDTEQLRRYGYNGWRSGAGDSCGYGSPGGRFPAGG